MRCAVLPLALALAACTSRPLPVPKSVEPAGGFAGSVVDVTVHGESFVPALQLDFDRPSRSVAGLGFAALLGDTALDGVTFVDEQTLNARVPGTLAPGTYPLTVVDPAGASGTVADAFRVDVETLKVLIESAPAGLGTEVGDWSVRVGAPLGLSAVARRSAGTFARDVSEAQWALTGVGGLSDDAGVTVVFTAPEPGTAVVSVSAGALGQDVTGTLTVLACTRAADCRDACHTVSACTEGACVLGAVDRDADDDGFVDALCAGGTDCNDSAPSVNPGASEGPAGEPSCSDGLDNDCNGLTDGNDPSCAAGNTPPVARFTVTPDAGVAGDLFSGDGSASSDAEDATAALTFAWDWNGDGRIDARGVTSTHRYTRAGTYRVVLRVTDTKGASATATHRVTVTAPTVVQVTTAVDESNANATPDLPGGAGFSLREAIVWANFAAGPQTIEIPEGMVVVLTRALPTVNDDGTVIVSTGGIVDGAALGSSARCFDFEASNTRLDGVEVRQCSGTAVSLRGTNSTVTRCKLHDNGSGVTSSGRGNTVGPDNELWAHARTAVDLSGRAAVVEDNTIRDTQAAGVTVRDGADGSSLVGNRLLDDQVGVDVRGQVMGLKVYFNALHSNSGAGLTVANGASLLDVRNNVFTSSAGWAIDSAAGPIATIDANDFFQNSAGACRGCASLGARSLAVDPLYTDAGAGDLRPQLTSPLINAGVDVGVDRNGARQGRFDGPAPDIGAYEVR